MVEVLEKFKDFRRLYPAVRVSWSAFQHWRAGRKDRLFDYLLSREPAPTVAQRRGRVFHQAVEGLDERLLRRLFSLVGVESPRRFLLEEKKEIKLDYEIPTVFVGVFDVLLEVEEGWVVVDWKTGKSPIRWYDEQILLYGLSLKLLGKKPKFGVLVKFNENLDISEYFEVEFAEENLADIGQKFDTFIQELHWWILTGELESYLDKISKEEKNDQV